MIGMIYFSFALISAILIFLATYSIILYIKMKKDKHKTDYMTLFIFGATFSIMSALLKLWLPLLIGIITSLYTLTKTKDWKKNRTDWKKMSLKEKENHIMLLLILLCVITISGFIWWFRLKCC